ncbi:MAG TPA: response regulator [Ktedonobacterales bacterium]|nr:response regulator [Ktedonobacterales bacterium]
MAQCTDAPEVLVVDDHEDTRDILAVILEEEGYTVFTASNGVSAVSRLRTHPTPLVVVLDWWMPCLDGLAVLRAMVTFAPKAQHHRYLLLTITPEDARPLVAKLPPEMKVELMGKPFNVDALLAHVARAAKHLRLQQLVALRREDGSRAASHASRQPEGGEGPVGAPSTGAEAAGG